MRIKKISKKIIKAFLIIISAVAPFVLGLFIYNQIRLDSDMDFLKEKGYYKPVSAGDYSVNLLKFGNEKGKHRIIAMAGFGVPDTCLTMRKMTSVLEKDNQVIFLDRAGYGASDDTEEEMTVENIVKAYRTALKNSGIKAPYILMPHSIGNVYATYWETKYPDEIEALAVIDGTELQPIDETTPHKDAANEKMMFWLDKLGIGNIGLRLYLPKNPDYSDDEQKIEDAMALMTYDSKAIINERENEDKNVDTVWNMIKTNKIPKIYISATLGFNTKEEIIENGGLSENYLEGIFPTLQGTEEEKTEQAYDIFLNDCKQMRKNLLGKMAKKLGNCKIVRLPGNHMIYEQKPKECGKIIKSFVDGLSK